MGCGRRRGVTTRFKIRGPSFSHGQTLPEMTKGEYVADLVATLGSLDPIMGDVDR